MALLDVLRARRAELATRWEGLVLASYPPPSAGFFGSERDPFKNPVGATVRRAVAELTFALLSDREEPLVELHALVRMRAVQGLGPAEAAGFVLLLRRAAAELLEGELSLAPAGELLELDERLDRLLLHAWESYARCRETLADLRAREATARTYALLKRAGLLAEPAADAAPAQEPAGLEGSSRA